MKKGKSKSKKTTDETSMTLKQFTRNVNRTLKNWDYYYQLAVEKEKEMSNRISNSGLTENNT